MRLVRYVLPALVTLGLLMPAVPALAAAKVVTKLGTFTAQEYYPTYTALVVITPDFTMKVIPTDQVVSIDGVPYAQAYWGTSELQSETIGDLGAGASPTVSASASAHTAAAAGAPIQLADGTRKVFDLHVDSNTWLRHGLAMTKRPERQLDGTMTSRVSNPGNGPVTLVEQSTFAGRTTKDVTETLAPRANGVYMLAVASRAPVQGQQRIGVPPRLWPASLHVGETWVVGPYEQMGASCVMRMQVVGRESVTVPSGTYPGAYKIVGFGHVCGGQASLANGRMVNQVSILEDRYWVVPGLGSVKFVRHRHVHGDFFPSHGKVVEQPLVYDTQETGVLREFSLGKQ